MIASPRPVEVLLVDDDDVDARAVQRVFEQYAVAAPLTVINDPEEALDRLRMAAGRRGAGHYLVLLDLNMPRMSGHEFLSEIRNDPQLHSTLVFVLTTSDRQEDKHEAYRHNVAGYLLKQHVERDRESFSRLVQSYCGLVQFPPV